MHKKLLITAFAVTFALGAAIGGFAAKKAGVTSAAWQGASPEEAAANLMEIAHGLAGKGSWENVHLARVFYVAGDQDKAEAIWSRYQGAGADAGDVIRIARGYAQAGDWEKAKPLFDRVLEMAPKDEDWLVEAGAYYNLAGDRERAEELFARGFELDPRNLNNTLSAAGSYLGQTPRKR